MKRMIELGSLRCSVGCDEKEIAILSQLYQEQLGTTRLTPTSRRIIESWDRAPRDVNIPAAQAAAAAVLAQAFLNHDVSVGKEIGSQIK